MVIHRHSPTIFHVFYCRAYNIRVLRKRAYCVLYWDTVYCYILGESFGRTRVYHIWNYNVGNWSVFAVRVNPWTFLCTLNGYVYAPGGLSSMRKTKEKENNNNRRTVIDLRPASDYYNNCSRIVQRTRFYEFSIIIIILRKYYYTDMCLTYNNYSIAMIGIYLINYYRSVQSTIVLIINLWVV